MEKAIIASIIALGFEQLRIHQGRPEGWKPSKEELDAFMLDVDNATTENRMAAARARLNIPAEKDTPQAPPGN